MARILLVEDNEANLYLLETLLKSNGYETMCAAQGAEALEQARREPPILVISDILMPVMDGFSLCREWMKDERLQDIPFVFYTATYTDPSDEEFALSLGAARFIRKPTEPAEFMAVLHDVIQQVETGNLVAAHEPVVEEKAYFQEYNAALVRKLEDKLAQLEQANRALEQEIAERVRAEQELKRVTAQTQRRLEQIEALRQIDRAISSSTDLRLNLELILNQVTSALGVDAAAILLLHRPTQMLEYRAVRGFHANTVTPRRLRLGEGCAGRAARERQVIFIPDLAQDPDQFVDRSWLERERFVGCCAAPLIAKGELEGVLEVLHRQPLAPDPEWQGFVEALAGQAAVAIENAELFQDLQRSKLELELAYDTTLEGWSHALDLRDRETEGHALRVIDHTLKLARALGLHEPELTHIRRGALLHDIGKMGIPDAILLKRGALSEAEREVIRQHPRFAYEMLSPILYLRPALEIPYCHHEKWDGSGYPRGLKGQEIPLAARLFAVVDVYDALLSDRPYRPAWTAERVRSYLQEQSGKYFDPEVAAAFVRLLDEEAPERRV